MARAPGGARRRGGGRRRDAAGGEEALRKGPWTAEEDAVLREHVCAHGPRDWSSIRSKGLLPRSGKSCRLRWVNKLRPNLKSGCKFSAEEERVVLELQAQFGNKWARIATYLEGRTDNDVKNFWSTRQKRLARLLRGPLPARSRKNSSAKAPAAISMEFQLRSPCLDLVPYEGSSSSGHQCCAATPFMDAQNAAPVPYDQTGSGLLGFEGALVPVVPASDSLLASSSNAALLQGLQFGQPPNPLLDFPGMPESFGMAHGFGNAGGMGDLAYKELLSVMQPAPTMFPFFGMECPHVGVKAEPPDARNNVFDDLPPDMFDSLDQLPPPLPPPVTKSEF